MTRAVLPLLATVVVLSGCAAGETGPAAEVSASGAVVTGRVVSDAGGEVEYWAEYGPSAAYGSATPHLTLSTERYVPAEVRVELSGLERSAVYHYRLCARDSQQRDGPGCGDDRTLRTQAVACGETVTADVRLTGDLICPDSPSGLVIGAPGIDVNLAGHGLTGPVFVGSGTQIGIDNRAGLSEVTIRNGALGGWGRAIVLAGASRNLIRNVSAQGSPTGISIEGGESNAVRGGDASGRITGLSVADTDRLAVVGNGVAGFFGDAMTISADRSRIAHNEVGRPGAQGRSSGISLSGSGNRIAANVVRGFALGGIVLGAGTANVVAENDVADGFVLQPGGAAAEGDGVFVASSAVGALLRANRAHDNAGDGIEVQSASTRLRANAADANGDLGIDAVPGVSDLGGNTAVGNGDPLQCRNVFCL